MQILKNDSNTEPRFTSGKWIGVRVKIEAFLQPNILLTIIKILKNHTHLFITQYIPHFPVVLTP